MRILVVLQGSFRQALEHVSFAVDRRGRWWTWLQDSRFVRMEHRQIWMLFEDFGHHGRRLFSFVTSGMALQGVGDLGPHFLIIVNVGTFAPVRRTFSRSLWEQQQKGLDAA